MAPNPPAPFLKGTVARCLEFLGREVDPDVIQNVVRSNSLENMRAKEDRAKTLPKSPGEEGRWIGKGAIRGWQRKLSERQLKIVDELAGDLLARLDYPRGVRHEERNLAGHFMDDSSMDNPSRDRQGGADEAVLRKS
jgi:hypothetical protein